MISRNFPSTQPKEVPQHSPHLRLFREAWTSASPGTYSTPSCAWCTTLGWQVISGRPLVRFRCSLGRFRSGCGVKVKPPGYGPQVLLHVSIYQGNPFYIPILDPHPSENRPSSGKGAIFVAGIASGCEACPSGHEVAAFPEDFSVFRKFFFWFELTCLVERGYTFGEVVSSSTPLDGA